MSDERQKHLDALVAEIGKVINLTFQEFSEARRNGGDNTKRAVSLDVLSMRCSEMAGGLQIVAERASALADELLGDGE